MKDVYVLDINKKIVVAHKLVYIDKLGRVIEERDGSLR